MRPRIAQFLAACVVCAAMLAGRPARAQIDDISRWHVEQVGEWGISVVRPPGWQTWTADIAAKRIGFILPLAEGANLYCYVGANPDPQTAGRTQAQLDAEHDRGPVSPAEYERRMTKGSGSSVLVTAVSEGRIGAFPSFVLEAIVAPHTVERIVRVQYVFVHAPGIDYIAACGAETDTSSGAEYIYRHNIGTIRGFMAGIRLAPPAAPPLAAAPGSAPPTAAPPMAGAPPAAAPPPLGAAPPDAPPDAPPSPPPLGAAPSTSPDH